MCAKGWRGFCGAWRNGNFAAVWTDCAIIKQRNAEVAIDPFIILYFKRNRFELWWNKLWPLMTKLSPAKAIYLTTCVSKIPRPTIWVIIEDFVVKMSRAPDRERIETNKVKPRQYPLVSPFALHLQSFQKKKNNVKKLEAKQNTPKWFWYMVLFIPCFGYMLPSSLTWTGHFFSVKIICAARI